MARKKRKSRVGHITSQERQDVRTSVDDAVSECNRRYRGHSHDQVTCIYGAEIVEHNLRKKGFALAGRRRK